ncbi:MAG: glycine cleavage system aminomethyltransferase GcvT [Rickettsiales bacterium]|nr:glycine cleavage system aminomethyltransferase GcvT [Rickettsiales bacterium]
MALKKTPLYKKHIELGAKMAEFAGFDMPLYYRAGIIAEHNAVRNKVGLFDVSHMGQLRVKGLAAPSYLNKITPSDFHRLTDFLCKYTVLTNEKGGIIDDLIITRLSRNEFHVVINAGCRDKDIAWFKKNLSDGVELEILENQALLAIQGAEAESILQNFTDFPLSKIGYMKASFVEILGEKCLVTRTGYTGEDGFEVSISGKKSVELWSTLVEKFNVTPAGLGSRDLLRLEMGYPLYGHDMNDETTPLEAGLGWVMSKDNDNYIGSNIVKNQKSNGIPRKRIGMIFNEKVVAREGSEIFKNGNKIGIITSGGFSPVLQKPISMGIISNDFAKEGEVLEVDVRGKKYQAIVSRFTFVQPKIKKIVG